MPAFLFWDCNLRAFYSVEVIPRLLWNILANIPEITEVNWLPTSLNTRST